MQRQDWPIVALERKGKGRGANLLEIATVPVNDRPAPFLVASNVTEDKLFESSTHSNLSRTLLTALDASRPLVVNDGV